MMADLAQSGISLGLMTFNSSAGKIPKQSIPSDERILPMIPFKYFTTFFQKKMLCCKKYNTAKNQSQI